MPAAEAVMSSSWDNGRVRADSRERTDLRKQYRPIGIGAVAAALEVVGDGRFSTREDRPGPANDKHGDQYRQLESIAA
jgi:hypothetical protein